jgi:diguanylate cyclase (GGDEF)-like protein
MGADRPDSKEKTGRARVLSQDTIRPDQAASRWVLDALRERASHVGSLLVIAGTPADVGLHLVVEGHVCIGRDESDLRLRDAGISRQHVAVQRRGSDYFVSDVGSRYGTRLNGEPLVGEKALQEGDKLLLGQTVIKFTMVDATEASYLAHADRLMGTDPLTGLVAKHRFDGAFDQAVRSARISNAPLCALMLDMDNLKSINQSHGHQAGAEIIRRVGKLLGEHVRNQGEACRFGGDEFCVVLPHAETEQAVIFAERVRHEVEQTTFAVGVASVRTTVSTGVASLQESDESSDALLQRADEALYRAKGKGRNCVSL